MIKKIFTIPNINLALCFTTLIFFSWAAVIAIADPNPRLSPEELNKVLAEKTLLVHTFMIVCIFSLIASVVLAFMSFKKARRRAIISLAINSVFYFGLFTEYYDIKKKGASNKRRKGVNNTSRTRW